MHEYKQKAKELLNALKIILKVIIIRIIISILRSSTYNAGLWFKVTGTGCYVLALLSMSVHGNVSRSLENIRIAETTNVVTNT